MKVFYEGASLTLYEGMADQYSGPVPDLVLTNPYGPLPECVVNAPMLVHQWVHRKAELQRWIPAPVDLQLVSLWNADREAVWAANFPEVFTVDLADLRPEPGGWWPLEFPRRLLAAFGAGKHLVWDGFMGRGTGAQAALELGMSYIGIDCRPVALEQAAEYLHLPLGGA